MRLIALLLIGLAVTSCNQPRSIRRQSQTKVTEIQNDSITLWIDNTIKTAMQENNITSLSVAIIRHGEVDYLSGYGVLKRNGNLKVTDSTIFQIASLSKMLTGIIINNLVLEKKLELNKPIINYINLDLSEDTKQKIKSIRLEDVLFHRSGLPYNSLVVNRIDGEPMLEGYSTEQIGKDLENMELEFEPDTQYAYSNLGYALLGYIAESVTGKTYSQLLDEYVAKKYDMFNTTEKLDSIQQKTLATPYRKDNRKKETKPWNTGKLTSASGIYSNVNDLSKLLRYQLAAYSDTNQENQLNPLLLTNKIGKRENEGSYYGLGIFEDKTKRGTVYGHRGDMDGYASEYSFNSNRNVGVVLLTSSGGKWIGYLSAIIMKKLEENAN